MKRVCQNCGSDEYVEVHHVVPGGSLTVDLCHVCHQKTHGLNGIGQPLGRPNKIPNWVRELVIEMRADGCVLKIIPLILNQQGVPSNGKKWRESSFHPWLNEVRPGHIKSGMNISEKHEYNKMKWEKWAPIVKSRMLENL